MVGIFGVGGVLLLLDTSYLFGRRVQVLLKIDSELLSERGELCKVLLVLLVVLNLGLNTCAHISRPISGVIQELQTDNWGGGLGVGKGPDLSVVRDPADELPLAADQDWRRRQEGEDRQSGT